VALAVKEILFMPEEVIQQRFNIKEDEGVVIEMMGTVTEGMVGTGFLYTNKDSLTIGVGCMLSDFKANPHKTTPYALLEKLKKHPSIAPLIEGGEMKEYCAHLIPEGGFHAVPKVYGERLDDRGRLRRLRQRGAPRGQQPGDDHRAPGRADGDRRQGRGQADEREDAEGLQGQRSTRAS
jgi:hypothetical protein